MTQKDTGHAGYYSEYLGPVEDKSVAMSLRDYFAGQALVGLLSSGRPVLNDEKLASVSYDIADAMIEARKETNT